MRVEIFRYEAGDRITEKTRNASGVRFSFLLRAAEAKTFTLAYIKFYVSTIQRSLIFLQ